MTKTFNFTTNIEKRMPTTGEVYFVDRMTSDYAVQHPFDVDGYLEQVYQKWQACETIGFRETREALRRQWDATLGCRNPRGNASLYPNKDGEKHPALMEVWHKAGDYWRRGLRQDDILPEIVPACRITRLSDGHEWIALFPKDMHLLTAEGKAVEQDLFAQMQQELETLREENRQLREERNGDTIAPAIEPAGNQPSRRSVSGCSSAATERRRQRQEREALRQQAEADRLTRETAEQEKADREQQQRKVIAAVGAVAVTLLMIHFFGLLGPAVFGLIAGGLLKG